MKTLETSYAGLKLKNPIIVSSSSLTDSAEKNKKLCEAGAGAIVLKSLFEEQIHLEVEDMEDFDPFVVGGNDLAEYMRNHKLEEYFALIRETKRMVDIPVIASINAYDEANWIDFAKKIEEAGADALEINILALQTTLEYQYGSFEKKHIDILKLVKKAVKIPVIMKLGDNFTNPVALIHQLRANGADGVDVYKHLAACYNGLGNGEQAMAMINAGLEKNPGDANLILEKVNAYLKEGKGAEAIEDLNRLRELDPENAQLLFVLGTIYGDENNADVFDSEKAVKYYEDAIKINPNYYDAIYNLGALYITMSNKLKAQANDITGFSKAEIEQYNKLIGDAEELLRTGLPYVKQAYEAQPTPEVKNVLKTMYVQLKMNEEAKALEEE
jgi:tetratricopeptide (TPR) repeat protein